MESLNPCNTIDELWKIALSYVCRRGDSRIPRKLACLSVGPVGLTLNNPYSRVLWNNTRKANRSFMAGELTWLISGSRSLDQIAFYNEKMKNYSDDGLTLAGAYGPMLSVQIPYVIKTLINDQDSRQAVLTLWKPVPCHSKDIPCTVAMQFRIVKGKVELTTFMRSNDLWLGFPYDVFSFTSIQEVVAAGVGLIPGPYHHVVGDLHLYEDHFALASMALHDNAESETTPPLVTSSFNDIQDTLRYADMLVRQRENSYEEVRISQDPFIAWVQQRLIERRKDANQKRTISRDN